MREIVLSKTAARKLDHLLEYLQSEWSERVKLNFMRKLDKAFTQIGRYPLSNEQSKVKIELHRCVITKQTTVFYRFDAKKIFIITLFDTRMDPRKLNRQLNK